MQVLLLAKLQTCPVCAPYYRMVQVQADILIAHSLVNCKYSTGTVNAFFASRPEDDGYHLAVLVSTTKELIRVCSESQCLQDVLLCCLLHACIFKHLRIEFTPRTSTFVCACVWPNPIYTRLHHCRQHWSACAPHPHHLLSWLRKAQPLDRAAKPFTPAQTALS